MQEPAETENTNKNEDDEELRSELLRDGRILILHDRFRRRRPIAYMICDHFRASVAHDAALDLSDLFNLCLQGDDIRGFDTRWDQALISVSEVPKENVVESWCKMKIRESVQLQTVSAMYEREIDPDRSMPSYQRLKTEVRRHIDQLIRTRNFRARNERIETGVFVKSHKGKNVSVELRMLSVESKRTVFKRRLLQFSRRK